MPLTNVTFDPAHWDRASEPRRREWEQAARALIDEHDFGLDARPFRLHVIADEGASQLEFHGEPGLLARIEVPAAVLGPRLAEYAAICRRMATLEHGEGSNQLEVLDMAKRLAHDEAARALLAHCEALQTNHATCRRLFTLLLTLHVDTTTLANRHLGPMAHRDR